MRVPAASSSSPRAVTLPFRSLPPLRPKGRSNHFAQRRALSNGPASPSASNAGHGWSFGTLALGLAIGSAASYGLARSTAQGQQRSAQRQEEGHQEPPPSSPNLEKALQEIQQYFDSRPSSQGSQQGEPGYSTEDTDLESKGFSSWCHHDASLPSVVVYPESTADVVAMVNISRNNGVPLVPFAGGTSLEAHWYAPKDPKTGKTIPTITIAFERMDGLVEHDEDNALVRVQPGLGWQDLNEELKSRGSRYFWPVDPGPGSCFGGMCGTGGSGTGAVRYGTMKGDLVLNVTVVLPSGEVIKTRSDARKSSAGPDLTKLFLGSEGTLGVITEVTLRLVPRLPESVVTVAFNTVDEACRAVSDILAHGVGVSSIELLDDVMITAINTASPDKKQHAVRPSLFIKFSGSEAHTAEDQRIAKELVAKHGADLATLQLSRDAKEVEDLWESRKVALWSAIEYRNKECREAGLGEDKARAITTDVCVPTARLPELVKGVKADLEANNVYGPIVGHVGDGNFHALLVYTNEDEFKRAKQVTARMVKLAQDLGGTCTGEHGIGRGKKQYLERELGKGTVGLLKDIKSLLDPKGLMNPGALYPDESST
ncbi:unnamed protein product [Parajaminaea phylloscopi]